MGDERHFFRNIICSIGMVVIAALGVYLYILYTRPLPYKFSCQIDRSKPNEPCQFILTGSHFLKPTQAFIMFPVQLLVSSQSETQPEASLILQKPKRIEFQGSPQMSFWSDKGRLVGRYRIEDQAALGALIAKSGYAILTPEKLSMSKDFAFKKELSVKIKCQAKLGEELKCEEIK